jgi:hypothetical protein
MDESERIFEGRCRGMAEIFSRHFPGGTEENHKFLSNAELCSGRNSK